MFYNILKILSIILILAISACGFRPLYATSNDQDSKILQQVHISPISNQEGQVLHNHLLDIMNPKGRPANALYTLSSEVSYSSTSLGVQSDDTTTRKVTTVTAKFIFNGNGINEDFTVSKKAGYSETDNVYATSVAEDDAIARSLREIAEDAKIRVASILKSNQ